MTIRFFGPLASSLLLLVAIACATASPKVESREEFPLDPREELAGPFPERVAAGAQALFAGDPARAEDAFSAARSQGAGLAAEIGWIEAAVVAKKTKDALTPCSRALAAGEPTLPLLVACGEAHARSGDIPAALELYSRAVARAPGRGGIARRAAALRDQASAGLAAAARASAANGDWEKARDEISRALVLSPHSAALHVASGDVEAAAGDSARALQQYREALAIEPGNGELAKKAAEMALSSDDYSVAVSLFDELARTDPRFRERAAEARLVFRIANWPAPEREAARAVRLTRAAAASLVWWMFPEVREANVATSVIASDVVGRRDSRALAKALSLGLLEVDRETHRANPDGGLSLSAAARLCLRLLAILHPSDEDLPCFGMVRAPRSGADAVRIAQGCELFRENEPSPVSGSGFTRALDRIRATASTSEAAVD